MYRILNEWFAAANFANFLHFTLFLLLRLYLHFYSNSRGRIYGHFCFQNRASENPAHYRCETKWCLAKEKDFSFLRTRYCISGHQLHNCSAAEFELLGGFDKSRLSDWLPGFCIRKISQFLFILNWSTFGGLFLFQCRFVFLPPSLIHAIDSQPSLSRTSPPPSCRTRTVVCLLLPFLSLPLNRFHSNPLSSLLSLSFPLF